MDVVTTSDPFPVMTCSSPSSAAATVAAVQLDSVTAFRCSFQKGGAMRASSRRAVLSRARTRLYIERAPNKAPLRLVSPLAAVCGGHLCDQLDSRHFVCVDVLVVCLRNEGDSYEADLCDSRHERCDRRTTALPSSRAHGCSLSPSISLPVSVCVCTGAVPLLLLLSACVSHTHAAMFRGGGRGTEVGRWVTATTPTVCVLCCVLCVVGVHEGLDRESR